MKHYSIKRIFSKAWRSVCKSSEFIGRMLGYKSQALYAKTIWKIIVGCTAATLLMFTIILGYFFVTELVMEKWLKIGKYKIKPYKEEVISNNVVLQKFGNGATRLYNKATEKTTIENLSWIVVSDDKDTLAVFAKGNKRGYVNRCTGEIEIPAIYTKAWVFSEGLAAVETNNKLVFIDRNGNVVIDRNFEVYMHGHNYAFKNGYCLMRSNKNGLFGFIDKNGNWILEPQFTYVHPKGKYIHVKKGHLEGLYTIDMNEVFPTKYLDICISYDQILVRDSTLIAKLYDMDLNLLHDFVVDGIEDLYYDTNETAIFTTDSNNGEVYHGNIVAIAQCRRYYIGMEYYQSKWGLMDAKGRKITPPIYDDIQAIGPDRYFCKPHGVIIDNKGTIIN